MPVKSITVKSHYKRNFTNNLNHKRLKGCGIDSTGEGVRWECGEAGGARPGWG